MTTTPKFGIPLISSQQAQPEVTHNQMVLVLQAIVGGAIAKQNAPPGSPADGDCYVVGSAGSGAWSDHDNAVAIFFGGWIFVPGVDDDGVIIDMGADQAGLQISIGGTPSIWTGSVWKSAGGGSAPALVQHAAVAHIGGAPAVTLGAAPQAGNCLIAFVSFWASNPAAADGWVWVTDQQSASNDAGAIGLKICGPGESATQQPSNVSSDWTVAMFEVSGGSIANLVNLSAHSSTGSGTGDSNSIGIPQGAGLVLGAFLNQLGTGPATATLGGGATALDHDNATGGSGSPRAIATYAYEGVAGPAGETPTATWDISGSLGHAYVVFV